jgi:cysteinyl-tRNA synthetase
MSFRVFNTLSKKLEEFTPLEPGKVRMYNCGPTVYDSPHIGNFRTFLFADTLRRWLEYSGHRVTQVMNLTDVGHLTEDAVAEDKMAVGLRRLRDSGVDVKDAYQVAEHFIREYMDARRELGFREAHVYPRATTHVPEMIEMIRALVDKGHAYQVGGHVYFDVRTFPAYGRLSGNTLDQMKADASERNEFIREKRHPADFALWKTDPGHLMQWESPWGRGFPGWHIECSAMSKKHLGETLDIHTGGEDNIFPHHDGEIAQSESANGKPFVRYWMHARHLLWNGKKMSKSDGTFFTVADMRKKYPALAIRYALTSSQYRMQVSFNEKTFDDAAMAVARLKELRSRLAPVAGAPADEVAKAKAAFAAAMNDDLNAAGALGAVHDFVTAVNRSLDRGVAVPGALETMEGFDSVFGFLDRTTETAPAEVQVLVEQRGAARKARDFKASDLLRDQIRKLGWIVEDTKDGQKLKKA